MTTTSTNAPPEARPRLRTQPRSQPRNDRLRIERDRAVWALAAACGSLVAVVNTSAPVDVGPVDALYRAGFAVATVWFAARARRWTWPILSGLAAVATASLLGQIAAVIALGPSAGALGARRRNRVMGAAIAAGSVPALLAQGRGPLERLTDGAIEDPFGTSAVITALAVAPVFGSGRARLGRRRRRHLGRIVRTGLVAVAAVVAVTVGLVALAVPSMTAGLRTTTDAGALGADGEIVDAAAELETASARWSKANRIVSGPWMLPGRLLPVVGQHIRATQVITGQAGALTQSSRAVAERLETDALVAGGRIDVDRLDALSPAVDALAATVATAEDRLDRARSPWLVPQLDDRLVDAVDRLGRVVAAVEASAAAIPIGIDLFGGDEPATIVVMFTTPAEARGAGGFVGSWAEFRTENGAVHLVEHRRSKALNDLLAATDAVLVADDDYSARYGRFSIERHIQDVTISPDFPSVAAVAADLYRQATGVEPDAIVMIDPYALEALLAFTGPVEADPTLTLTAGNAAEVLLRTQYERFADDEEGRERLLDALASELVERLVDEPPDPIAFARALAPLAEAGRVAVWSADDLDGSIVDGLALAAAFPEVTGDLLAVVHQNGGQNKIDAHLRRELELETTLHPDPGQASHDLRVTLHNDAPPAGLSDAVIGSNDQGLPPGTNRLTLSVYSPLGAAGATIDGTPVAVEAQTEFGVGVYSIAAAIPPQSSIVVELTLNGRLDLEDGYAMVFDSQPLVRPDDLVWRVSRGDGERLEAPEGFVERDGALVLDTRLDEPRHYDVPLG